MKLYVHAITTYIYTHRGYILINKNKRICNRYKRTSKYIFYVSFSCYMWDASPLNVYACPFWACSVNELSQLFYIYVTHCWHMFDIYVTYGSHVCNRCSSVPNTYIWHTCNMHVTYMTNLCHINLTYGWHICYIYVTYMAHICNIYVKIHATYICQIYVVLVRVSRLNIQSTDVIEFG